MRGSATTRPRSCSTISLRGHPGLEASGAGPVPIRLRRIGEMVGPADRYGWVAERSERHSVLLKNRCGLRPPWKFESHPLRHSSSDRHRRLRKWRSSLPTTYPPEAHRVGTFRTNVGGWRDEDLAIDTGGAVGAWRRNTVASRWRCREGSRAHTFWSRPFPSLRVSAARCGQASIH